MPPQQQAPVAAVAEGGAVAAVEAQLLLSYVDPKRDFYRRWKPASPGKEAVEQPCSPTKALGDTKQQSSVFSAASSLDFADDGIAPVPLGHAALLQASHSIDPLARTQAVVNSTSQLQASIVQLERERNTLQAALAQESASYMAEQKRSSALVAQVQELQGEVSRKSDELARLSGQLNQLMAITSTLLKHVESTDDGTSAGGGAVADLIASINANGNTLRTAASSTVAMGSTRHSSAIDASGNRDLGATAYPGDDEIAAALPVSSLASPSPASSRHGIASRQSTSRGTPRLPTSSSNIVSLASPPPQPQQRARLTVGTAPGTPANATRDVFQSPHAASSSSSSSAGLASPLSDGGKFYVEGVDDTRHSVAVKLDQAARAQQPDQRMWTLPSPLAARASTASSSPAHSQSHSHSHSVLSPGSGGGGVPQPEQVHALLSRLERWVKKQRAASTGIDEERAVRAR